MEDFGEATLTDSEGNVSTSSFVPNPAPPLVVDDRDRLGRLIFTGDKGGALQRSNFNPRVKWAENVEAIGAEGLHFHDLRHTGNTLAAMTGASLRDLMTRMGHDSMRAALIYQHNTQGRRPEDRGRDGSPHREP